MGKLLHIAIDGPVAAGKGTVAKNLAQTLGILYIDTGSMYRAVGLVGIRKGIEIDKPKNEDRLLSLVKKSNIAFKIAENNRRFSQIYLGKENISDKIRTQEISNASSLVARLPKIRKYLVNKQKEIARNNSVVMEGRDITTVVLPKADLKIYLTADRKERARRRHLQLEKRGIRTNYKDILEDTRKRDKRDLNRRIDPLTIAPDAVIIDTTKLSIKQVVEKILAELENG